MENTEETVAESTEEIEFTPAPRLRPDEIRAIRLAEKVSQKTFGMYLNVTEHTVAEWEKGDRKPSGPAFKLLALARENGLASIR